MLNKILAPILFLLVITSCKKAGCDDEIAKNYDENVTKNDGSCKYYTKEEFIINDLWKFQTASSVDLEETVKYNSFYENATINFDTVGGNFVKFIFPSNPQANVTRTWTIALNDSKEDVIILDLGLGNQKILKIEKLTITDFTFSFVDQASTNTITINCNH